MIRTRRGPKTTSVEVDRIFKLACLPFIISVIPYRQQRPVCTGRSICWALLSTSKPGFSRHQLRKSTGIQRSTPSPKATGGVLTQSAYGVAWRQCPDNYIFACGNFWGHRRWIGNKLLKYCPAPPPAAFQPLISTRFIDSARAPSCANLTPSPRARSPCASGRLRASRPSQ